MLTEVLPTVKQYQKCEIEVSFQEITAFFLDPLAREGSAGHNRFCCLGQWGRGGVGFSSCNLAWD
jgi:hypothetical protein